MADTTVTSTIGGLSKISKAQLRIDETSFAPFSLPRAILERLLRDDAELHNDLSVDSISSDIMDTIVSFSMVADITRARLIIKFQY